MARNSGLRHFSGNIAIAVSAVVFAGSIADAALIGLAPNQTLSFSATPAVDTLGLPTGPLQYYEPAQTLVNNPGSSLSGTITSWVYDDTPSTTTLDFVYLLTNTGGATSDSFDQMTLSPFGTFTTNVGYQQTGIDPSGANRVGNNIIDWFFTGNTISPGNSSDLLVIQTNATGFTFGNGEVLDGGSAGATVQIPFASNTMSLPEPASMTLAVLTCGLVLGRRRRRSI